MHEFRGRVLNFPFPLPKLIPEMEIAYLTRFRAVPQIIVRSPGRINLIGEHTDYNQGFVLPGAIDQAITISVGLMSSSQSPYDELYAADRKQYLRLETQRMRAPEQSWTSYIWGMLDGLGLLGRRRRGFRLCFGGEIPTGAGLSSSAALCVGLGLALSELYDLEWNRDDIAHIAQRAEREFAGVNCGIMDQYASLFGRAGHFMKMDCRDLTFDYIPAELGDYTLLLCDSRVKHALAATAYNRRREECAIAVEVLQARYPQIFSLRDARRDMLPTLQAHVSPEVYKRCKYVIEENERVHIVADALRAGDMATVGECLSATHEGLQHDYEVSCREIDFLIDLARPLPYVLGARLMGGGFGGCTLNLILKSEIEDFKALLSPQYFKRFAKPLLFYEVHLSDGGSYLKR